MADSSSNSDHPGTLAQRTWLPLAFVVVALVLLLGTPIVVSDRVRHVRENLLEVADEARLVVNDFEASFANELIAMRGKATGAPWADTVAAAAVAQERGHTRALDTLMARLGPDAVERFVSLRTSEKRWRDLNASGPKLFTPDSAYNGVGREVLSSAESLDDYLVRISARARDDVRRLERINVYSAAALAPIALVAVGIVFGLDRRMRVYAGAANDRTRRLQRSVEQRETLIRGVTHDIKNPIGAASGYAALLEDGLAGPLNPQQGEMVHRLQRLLGTAQQTVAELVELARVDGGHLPIERRETDLVETVRCVVDDYQARAAQKGLALSLSDAPREIPVVTDATRVRHVLENLISNAIKYTPPGGVVSVNVASERRMDAEAPRVRVSVRDTGPGIPAAYRERIFDEFFRLPTTSDSVPGTGLGLAISRRIARLLGGDITLDPATDRGSVFTLSLPGDENVVG